MLKRYEDGYIKLEKLVNADPRKPSERYSDSDTDSADPGIPSERYSDSDTDITDPRKPESDDNLPSCSGAYHDLDISGENNLYYIREL